MNLDKVIRQHNLKYKVYETVNGIPKSIIAIYPGRFQPFSKHHKEVYDWMVKQFGRKNSFIVTSNKVDVKSPFDFKTKQRIIAASGVPMANIIQERSPYVPLTLSKKYSDSAAVFILGAKDADRLKVGTLKKDGTPRYFKRYDPNQPMDTIQDSGYVAIAPNVSINIPGIGELSGTVARSYLKTMPKSEFKNILAFSDSKIYDEIKGILGEGVIDILSNFNIDYKTIMESNSTGTGPLAFTAVDDGPRAFVGNLDTYQVQSNDIALKIGFSVVNWILDPEKPFEYYDSTEPPQGPYAPSFFPSGVPNDEDYSSAQLDWNKHVTSMAALIGYKIVEYIKTGL